MSDTLTAVGATFTVDAANLKTAVAALKKTAGPRVTFATGPDGVTVSTQTFDLVTETLVDANIHEAGHVTVDFATIDKFLGVYTVAGLRKNPVQVQAAAGHDDLTLTAGNRERIAPTVDGPVDWLRFDTVAETMVDASVFTELVPAAQADGTRPINGVCLTGVDAVATDSYRMHVVRDATNVGDNSLIVPLQVAKQIAAATGPVGLEWDSDVRIAQFTVLDTGVTYRAKLVDGTYPNYPGLLDTVVTERFDVDVADMREAVRLIRKSGLGAGSKNGRGVAPTILAGTVDAVEVSVSESGKGSEKVTIPGRLAEGLRAGFNAQYLDDLFDHLDGDSVHAVIDAQKPMMFREPRGAGGVRIRLLMPIRLPS